MKRYLIRSSCLLPTIGLCVASGCTFIDNSIDRNVSMEDLSFLDSREDVHVDEVLAALGPPQHVSTLAGGYAFLYQHQLLRERQFGISGEQPFLRWFKLSVATADVDSTSIVMQFDGRDRLSAVGYTSDTKDLGRGAAVQLLFIALPLVDAGPFMSEPWDVNRWGASLLRANGIALPADQSMDSGQAGFELRGTPVKVGQRTLEDAE